MARYIFSSSNSGLASASSKLKAGAPFVTNDVVQMMANGQAAPARTSDYAAVANAGTGILAATSATNNAVTQSYSGSLSAQGPDGSIYFLKSGALDKYSVAGVLIQSYTITTLLTMNNLFFLSNGNLCITGVDGSTNAYYMIYNTVGMVQVVAPTLMTASSGYAKNLATIPLVGGGFAALYSNNSTAITATLAVYSNAGVLLGSAAITTTAGSYPALFNLAQLSNGNIVVCYYNNTYQVAVYSALAVIQVPAFNAGFSPISGTYNTSCPYFSVMNGYFALAHAGVTCAIYNNSGVQQGSTFAAVPMALAYPAYTCSVVNDGSVFWLVYLSNTALVYVSITTAGVRLCTKSIVANTALHRPMRPSPQNLLRACRSESRCGDSLSASRTCAQ